MTSLAVEANPAAAAIQEQTAADLREQTLRNLLPYDYSYANEAGLIDMFYYDPNTGEDGLLHTLAGDISPTTLMPRGFHHAPSAEAVWPKVLMSDGSYQVVTRPLREGSDRPRYPMEPSAEFVAIGGMEKLIRQRDPNTGEMTMVRGKYGMFPDEYDALAVMQAIRIARDTRDPSSDQLLTENRERPVIVTEGSAPLIDGKSSMKIRLVLDAETGKVTAAFPKTPRKPIMGLTEKQMWQHILGE